MTEPIYLAGCTASGKSAVALELARRLNGEIISVDSMQVYRGLDIGTAKPSRSEQSEIPHHLIDVADLAESFDAARFVRLAEQAEESILARGKRVIYCGGTGLYFKALVAGVGSAPPADAKVRKELSALDRKEMLLELEAKDPETFGKIDQGNPRRLIRALEVIRLTGRPFSEFQSDWKAEQGGIWFGLERQREDLVERINQRVDAMFEQGLLEETRGLMERGLERNPTAMQAIGYRQVVEHLRGERGLPETIELVKIKTRQFAKRQNTWFKRQLELEWLPVNSDETPETVAKKILSSLE
ncbi:MAG: tRNA (adenosine(37)-N6)-dimethylallyltransferase MiaA [Verrucomicrobiota bacterium]